MLIIFTNEKICSAWSNVTKICFIFITPLFSDSLYHNTTGIDISTVIFF
ncbi:hypothetical protein CLOSTHATH_02542 [Hungatella hathewayi DSM 13479]|uniref:Uncharacterized protein n=1 Tax=Hungatella hathewayi DSM 13479 TaxID=566550 RepID=D3AG06_9FIRM|nr:hypothetical protein CLOSTHATH_02542 [Hungatella hathewayi DSM 13479]